LVRLIGCECPRKVGHHEHFKKAGDHYDLPEARSFSTSFCGKCGSPVPHSTRSGREIIIPAGSLDNDPQVKPSTIVHFESRAEWSNSLSPEGRGSG
jgi:hypothetical protein